MSVRGVSKLVYITTPTGIDMMKYEKRYTERRKNNGRDEVWDSFANNWVLYSLVMGDSDTSSSSLGDSSCSDWGSSYDSGSGFGGFD